MEASAISDHNVRATEQRLQLLTDSLPALVSYVGRDRIYKFVNRRYTQWFEMEARDIVGKSMTDVLGESAMAQIEPYIDRVLRGETVSFESWIEYKGAGKRFVHVSYVPDLHDDGPVDGFYALVTDFSGQRRVEDSLRSSEGQRKTLTDSFSDYAIFSLDRAGRIQSWNPGGVNIFGYQEEEILGRHIDVLYTPEDVASRIPEKEMDSAAKLGKASDERWHLRKDGSRFFANGVMMPLYDGDELTGFAKIATDLTEKRRQAEELQRAYDEMEIRVRERTQDLAAANESLLEEIRERRSSEAQRIQLLQRLVTTQEDERRRIARDLHDQLGQRMTGMRLKLAALHELCAESPELCARTNRLKQLAEMLDSEIGFLAWELRPAALDELGLVTALATFVGEWSRHYDTAADFHTSGTLNLRLSSDAETQVYRIVQESLNNVAKHSDATQVSVIFERSGESLILVIEDNGKGFVPEDIGMRESGRGLGLAGMGERAELIGGEIEIESQPGSGTTVYLRIPNITDENGGSGNNE